MHATSSHYVFFFPKDGTGSEVSSTVTKFSRSRIKYEESDSNSHVSSEVTEEELDEDDEIQSPLDNTTRGSKSSRVSIYVNSKAFHNHNMSYSICRCH